MLVGSECLSGGLRGQDAVQRIDGVRRLVASNVSASVTQKVSLVYGREGGRDEAKWNNKNVKAATGWGAMINLMYDKPDLQVEFKVAGDAIGWEEQFVSDIYFYDDYGNCSPMPLQSEE